MNPTEPVKANTPEAVAASSPQETTETTKARRWSFGCFRSTKPHPDVPSRDATLAHLRASISPALRYYEPSGVGVPGYEAHVFPNGDALLTVSVEIVGPDYSKMPTFYIDWAKHAPKGFTATWKGWTPEREAIAAEWHAKHLAKAEEAARLAKGVA